MIYRACLLLAIAISIVAEGNAMEKDTASLYNGHYSKAAFAGGKNGLGHFFVQNMQYPEPARDNNIEGRVIVQFLVDENGMIVDPRVIRSIGGGCDQEALRIVKSMPAWIPASYKGRPTSTIVKLPVLFKLE